ncbi:MAG: hypothetical protein GWO24_05520, partial [Akkermansiaceae bacterium]|nr:hypothetical protein [Akkermansiaceae bacterium]
EKRRVAWNVVALLERLAPELRALESFRQKILAKRSRGYTVLLMVGLACALAGAAGFAAAPPFGALFGVVPFCVVGLVVHSRYFGSDRAVYESEYKTRIIGGLTR